MGGSQRSRDKTLMLFFMVSCALDSEVPNNGPCSLPKIAVLKHFKMPIPMTSTDVFKQVTEIPNY